MIKHKKYLEQWRKRENHTKAMWKNRSRRTCILLATILSTISVSAFFAIFFSLSATPLALATPQITDRITTQFKSDLSSAAEQSAQLTEPNPMFNIEITYAYVGPRIDHFTDANPLRDKIPIETLYAKSLYPSTVHFNVKNISDSESISYDAKLEVYLIQISSDKGYIENYTYFVATNCNPSFSDTNALKPAISQIKNLIDEHTYGRLTGNFAPNITTNHYSFSGEIGSLSTFTSSPSELGLWNYGEPNTITISIRRTGWITLKGSVASNITASTDDIAQVTLEKFNEGFLYNQLVPKDKLSLVNPFNPNP
jgi:hypothetical protein